MKEIRVNGQISPNIDRTNRNTRREFSREEALSEACKNTYSNVEGAEPIFDGRMARDADGTFGSLDRGYREDD